MLNKFKIPGFLKGRTSFVCGIVFLAVSFPINHFFFKDQPGNPLEQAEEFVIRSLTGIDVDLNPQD